ncbi:hypothetical protein [Ralstonia phage RSL2]|uniref:Uncharacterized protein n=1 Tax=Ralstonia phage RSL2 TaxID=1585840 RepID=A0A0A8J9F8_9CAUD|nr:hypothetical protein [Ralstonia phage RSL2]
MAEPGDFDAPATTYGQHIFAFEDALKLWSAVNSLVLLRELGFHIAIYDSEEHIVYPDGQVAIVKDKATLVESHEIHEFPFENYI